MFSHHIIVYRYSRYFFLIKLKFTFFDLFHELLQLLGPINVRADLLSEGLAFPLVLDVFFSRKLIKSGLLIIYMLILQTNLS